MKIVEGTWGNKPTFFIVTGNVALKFIDPVAKDLFWTSRWDFAWHTPSYEKAKEVLEEVEELSRAENEKAK